MKFYPADWQADQALRSVGLAARCLWLECMCIMHRAKPYGHLVIHGNPVTDTQLAVLAGASPDQVPALIAELETAGVFSRNREGLIYSRRMTRDEQRRKDGEEAAITGKKVPNSRRSQAITKAALKLATPRVVVGVAAQPPPPPYARSSSLRSEVSSVADATDGELPSIDPIKAIWDRGVAILGGNRRSLLGRMIKQYKEPAVLAAIIACEKDHPVEPAAYFIECCERRANGSASHERALDELADWARREDEPQGLRGRH